MRAITSSSTVTIMALIATLLGATASQADEAAPSEGTSIAVAVAGPARASGVVVTTLTGDTRVVDLDGVVPASVAERAADALELRPDVVSAVPDYIRSAADASPVAVDDPFFPQQTSIWDTARPAGGNSTRAPAFWRLTAGSPSVRVAVIDTGKTAHPDLTWEPGWDFVDGDPDPTDPDVALGSSDFHGTHVAGTVAARANNRIGVVGVAPGVSVVPVRVLGTSGTAPDSRIAAGIRWAAGEGNASPVQVINMSLGGAGPCSRILADAIALARSRGIVVVVAAGNESRDAAGSAPANCPGVIAVGATDAAGSRTPFSNVGPVVDMSAPGESVLSTVALRGGRYGYGFMSGTSMASPAVAGAAALLFSAGYTGPQIEATLPRAVTPATSAATASILDLSSSVVLPPPPPAPARASTTVSVRTTAKIARGKRAVLRVRLRSSPGARPAGTIRVYDGSKIVRTVFVSARRSGSITVKTPRLKRKGTHRLRVVYAGTSAYEASRSVVRVVTVR